MVRVHRKGGNRGGLEAVLKEFPTAHERDASASETALRWACFGAFACAAVSAPTHVFASGLFCVQAAQHTSLLGMVAVVCALLLARAYDTLAKTQERALFAERKARVPASVQATGHNERARPEIDLVTLRQLCASESAAYAVCTVNLVFLVAALVLGFGVLPPILDTFVPPPVASSGAIVEEADEIAAASTRGLVTFCIALALPAAGAQLS